MAGTGAPTVSIRVPSRVGGRKDAPLPLAGGPALRAAHRQAWLPGRGGCCPVLTGIIDRWVRDCGRGPSSGGGATGLGNPPVGKARRTAGGRGGGGARPEPRLLRLPLGRALWEPRAQRPHPPPRPLPRPPGLRSCKGISTFFPLLLLLRRPPVTLKFSQALLLQRPRQCEPGALEVPAVGFIFPSPSCPLLYAVGVPPVLSPQGLGPGLGLPFSSPRQHQALRGQEWAPRSPRQVREGCVDSFSCGEQVAPRSGPFCSLYFILKLYLMLLYERGRGGKRAVRHPMCKCLIYYACIRDKL